jgi:hypothetical protein
MRGSVERDIVIEPTALGTACVCAVRGNSDFGYVPAMKDSKLDPTESLYNQ